MFEELLVLFWMEELFLTEQANDIWIYCGVPVGGWWRGKSEWFQYTRPGAGPDWKTGLVSGTILEMAHLQFYQNSKTKKKLYKYITYTP